MDKRKKFSELTPEDIEYLIHIYYEEDMVHREKMEILIKKFGGVTDRTIRRWWREELNLTETFSRLPDQLREAQLRQIDEDTEIVLVTAAQNKTGVNTNFLKNLKTYADFLTNEKGKKTQIIISPSRYRNPTSPTENTNKSDAIKDWWRDEVRPYLYYGKIQFGDTIISSDSRVRPTSKEPLTGYEVLAKDNHLIIPHSKIHFKTLPRFKNSPLRVMCTTGFITVKNYSDSKSGDQAFASQSSGFVVVEKKNDDTCYIPRNVKVNNQGEFTDIIFDVKFEKVSLVEYSEALIMGDIHTRVVDKEILEKTMLLSDMLKPSLIFAHDCYDGASCNPHEKKDMFIQRQKIVNGDNMVEKEVEEALDLIQYLHDRTGAKIIIPQANHDDFLTRMVDDDNWKRDLFNSPAYLKYAYIQQTVDLNEYGNIFGYLVHNRFKGENIKYLTYQESYNVCGYECGQHGNLTINGGRTSYKALSRLNMKLICGHTHSPVLHNNVTSVGLTARLDQYYNRKGLSSWAHAHSVIHPNCKNQLLVFDDCGQISGLVPL